MVNTLDKKEIEYEVIENISMSVGSYVEAKGIELVFDTEMEEKLLACDPYKIERVFLNLFSNAIKFTNPGGKIIVNVLDGEDSIDISFRDTGIGMPEEAIGNIFDRFKQVDSPLHKKYEGSGIGLSLVKSIIEAHGGRVSVSSKLGEGTEFLITLPVRTLDEQEAAKREVAASGDTNIERISIEFSDIYQ